MFFDFTPYLAWLGLLLTRKPQDLQKGIEAIKHPFGIAPPPTPTTTEGPTTTTSLYDLFSCTGREPRRYPHTRDCAKYFVCMLDSNIVRPRRCAKNLHFSPTALVCTLPRDSGCVALTTPKPDPDATSATRRTTTTTTARPHSGSLWLQQVQQAKYYKAVDEDNLVMYYNRDIRNPRSIVWPITFTRDAWESLRRMYGRFGNDRLYVVLHGKPQPQDLNFATYLDASKGRLNAMEVGSSNWAVENATNVDLIARNLAQIVVRSARGVRYPGLEPGWADILVHNIFNVTNRPEDQARWIIEMEREAESNVANVPMYTQWYLPIYRDLGMGGVLNRFFLARVSHFPIADFGDIRTFARAMNRGEFIHFWSNAAGRNLTELGGEVFGWSTGLMDQYHKARTDFPLEY